MKRLFNISIATSCILVISGCQMEEDIIVNAPNYHVISARFENSGTRTFFEEIPSSFDLTTKWQGHEYINVFYMMTDTYHETTPNVQVSEITEDGFGATFTYKVPEEWDKNDVYDVKLFTSPCFPKIMDGRVYYNASIIREPISSFQVPVYSEGEINAEGKLNATFHHYYTYELLHISNTSDSDIEFSLHGFEGSTWYKEKGSLCIDDGSFVVDAPSTKQPRRESNPITIRPGETQIIVSAYIPNGGTINDAKMVAKINGEITYSSNTKTSGIELKQGHAYHMYAGWNGEKLEFWKDGEEPLDVKTLNASLNSKVISGSFTGTVTNHSIEGLEIGFRFWKDEPEDYVEYRATPGEDNTFTLTLTYNDFVEIANSSPVKGVYKVSAFVIDENKNYYHGDVLEFTIDKEQPEWPTEPTEGDLIDMGLSVKWASCNVGASKPQDIGGFYAWGETKEKTEYTWANYELSNGSEMSIKKYCTESTYGIVDNRIKLELSDDVAYVDSQGKMRMPTTEEWQELLDECHWSRITYEGQVGYLYASPFTGNAIFIPSNGLKYNLAWVNQDSAYYWSSDLSTDASKYAVSFHGDNIFKWNRQEGIGVRAVSDNKGDAAIEVNPTLLEFGEVAVGSSVSKSITITNTGNGSLTFYLAGGDDGLMFTPTEEVTLEKGQSCEVTITFCPQKVAHFGYILRVFSNAANGTKYIECEGEGVAGTLPVPDIVDLGLPSGLKWASFNLGATKPEEYGDYYAWGETEPYYSSNAPLIWKQGKEAGYDWPSYGLSNGSYDTMTKYCSYSSYGYKGFLDEKTVLDPEDDVAHVSLGGKWRMPTDKEWMELKENCNCSWTTQNGVKGRLLTGRNGSSLFIPAAGYLGGTNLQKVGTDGYYWSSSLNKDRPYTACFQYFQYSFMDSYREFRFFGYSVRAVYDDSESSNYILHDPSPADGETGVDPHVYLTCYGHLYDKGENIFEVRVSEKSDMSVLLPRIVRYTGPYVYAVDFELESNKTYFWQVAEFDFEMGAWVIVSPIWHFTTQ